MESQVLLFSSELQLSYTDLLIERRPITQWECYEGAVEKLKEHCPEMRLPQVLVCCALTLGPLFLLYLLAELVFTVQIALDTSLLYFDIFVFLFRKGEGVKCLFLT